MESTTTLTAKRPAMLGGSFDPVHLGHLHLADSALATGHFDLIYLVPARRNPHKECSYRASDRDRRDMLCAAVEGRPGLAVLDWELERFGPSYTADTLEQIRRVLPDPKQRPGLILGDDLLQRFEEWHEYRRILDAAVLLVGLRNGGQNNHASSADERASKLARLGAQFELLPNATLPVSSTEVRERIAEGLPYRDLVPESVYAIIESRKLYR